MADKDEVNRIGNETKDLQIFGISKKSTGASYLIYNAKKAFNILWQMFT